DQLDSDELRLTLFPAEREPFPQPEAPKKDRAEGDGTEDDDEGGPLTELTLRRAEATGHAVWLQSPAQGIKILGNQLIHTKPGPGQPDETYFRADAGKRLHLEKIDYVARKPDDPEAKRTIQSITDLRTVDATIFQNGNDSSSATIVARGPGTLETRPDR